jgi:hypothetical protein
MSYDCLYPTFCAAAHKLEADWAEECADVILRQCPVCERDSIIGHEHRRKQAINITTGLASGAATAPAAVRALLSSRRFLSLTPTIACWLVAKPCGGALRSTALGKRRRLRSRTLMASPIPPHSAAGPAA